MNELLKLNEQLWGLPSGPLIAIFAIALGYLLKTLPFVDNRYIPHIIVVVSTALFMLIAPDRIEGMELRIYIVRNLVIGFIIGFAAWAFHAQILKRWVDGYLKFLPENKPTQPPNQP